MADPLRLSVNAIRQFAANRNDVRSEKDIAADILVRDPTNKIANQVANASFVDMAAIETNDFLGELGFKGKTISDNIGAPQFVGQGVEMLINSTFEAGGLLLSSLIGRKARFVGQVGLGLTSLGSGKRNFVETADPLSAVGSALSLPVGAVNANILGKVFLRNLTGRNSSKLMRGAAEATGNFVGGASGDVVEIGLMPTGDSTDTITDRFTKNIPGFFGDANNVGAYLIAQTPFAAVGAAKRLGDGLKRKIGKRVQNTTSLDQTFNTEAEVRSFLQSNGINSYPQNNFAVLGKIADDVKRAPKGFGRDTAQLRILNNLADNIGGFNNLSAAQQFKVTDLKSRESESKNQMFLNKQQELLGQQGYKVETSEAGDINRLFFKDEEIPIEQAPNSIKPILDQIHRHFIHSKSTLFNADETLLKFNIVPEIAESQAFKSADGFANALYKDTQYGGKFSVPTKLGTIGEAQLKNLRTFRKQDPALEPFRHRFYHTAKLLTLKGYIDPQTFHSQFDAGQPIARIKAEIQPIISQLDLDINDLTPELSGKSTRDLELFKQNLDRARNWEDARPMFSLAKAEPADFLYLTESQAAKRGVKLDSLERQIKRQNLTLHNRAAKAGQVADSNLADRVDINSFMEFDGDRLIISPKAPDFVRKLVSGLGATRTEPARNFGGDQTTLFSIDNQANIDVGLANQALSENAFTFDEIGNLLADNDGQALVNYINKMKGIDSASIRQFNAPAWIRGVSTAKGEIGVNLKQTKAKAFGTLNHELTHLSLRSLKESDPRMYNSIDSYIHDNPGGLAYSRAMLNDLAKMTGADHVDIDYAMGDRFDSSEPAFRDRVTQEIVAAMSEMVGFKHHKDSQAPKDFKTFLTGLPGELVRFFGDMVRKMKSLIGPRRPSAQSLLVGGEQRTINDALNILDKSIFRAEKNNEIAQARLSRADKYSPDNFVEYLDRGVTNVLDSPGGIPAGMRTYMNDLFSLGGKSSEAPIVEKKGKLTIGEKWFLDGLSLSRRYEWTIPFFNGLRRFRDTIAERVMGNYVGLGQNKTGDRSLQDASDWLEGYVGELVTNKTAVRRVEAAIDANQRIRANKSRLRTKPFQSKDDLLTVEEMKTDFKLNDDDIQFVQNIAEEGQRIALTDLKDMSETDSYNEAALVYVKNREKMTPDQAVDMMRQLHSVADNVGATEARIQRNQATPQDLFQAQNNLELEIRNSFQENGVALTGEQFGTDPLVNMVKSVMMDHASRRVRHTLATAKPGYVPRVRTRRFIVMQKDPAGGDTPIVADFDTDKQAQAFITKNKLGPDQFKLFDKEDAIGRYRYFNFAQIEDLALQTRDRLAKTIEDHINNFAPEDPTREALSQVLQDFDAQQADDIRQAIAVRGDPFKQKRRFAEGFDKADYIPNFLEYMNNRAVTAKRALTAARTRLEILRPESERVVGLRDRQREMLNYVLNTNQQLEAGAVRKWTFLYYLGSSVKHVAQNMTQVPMIGIPKMTADSGSYLKAVKFFGKASVQGARYATTGTTGNALKDQLLKTAEERSITNPNFLEVSLPDAGKSTSTMTNVDAIAQGRIPFGSKFKLGAAEFKGEFEKMIRSSAEFGEVVNRRTSFLMGVENALSKGVTDPEQIFQIAARHTDEVNFVGDKSNRPGFMLNARNSWTHNPLMMATALKSFMINYVGSYSTFWKEGRIGSLDVTTLKRNELDASGYKPGFGALVLNAPKNAANLRNPSVRAFYAATGHLVAFSGLMGFLAMEDLNELFESVTGINLERAIRLKLVDYTKVLGADDETGNKMADAMLRGLPEAMGVSASGSIGLGNVVGFRQGIDFNVGQVIMGAPGSVAVNVAGGVSEFGKDVALTKDPLDQAAWSRFIRTVAPQGINYWIRNADSLYQSQYLDRRGHPQLPPGQTMDSVDQASLLLGFTPTKVNKQRRATFDTEPLLKRRSDERNRVVNRAALALFQFTSTGSQEDRVLVTSLIDALVDKYPDMNKASLFDSVKERADRFTDPRPRDIDLAQFKARQEIKSAFPSIDVRPQSRLSSRLEDLVSGAQLGRIESLSSLSSEGIRSAVLADALEQIGLPGSLASVLTRNNKRDPLRQSRILGDPVFLPRL